MYYYNMFRLRRVIVRLIISEPLNALPFTVLYM